MILIMSTTSKKYFEKKFKNDIWEEFIKDLSAVKSENELNVILSKLLTPQEQIMLEKRLAVLNLLNAGKTYREISEVVDVHYNTISFIKKQYKLPPKNKSEKNPSILKWGGDNKLKYKRSIFHHRPNRFI